MTDVVDNFLWVEKFRPHTVDSCILPPSLKSIFKTYVEKGEIQNMLLCGTAGTGKTTIARALCEELGCDYLLVNGSEESGIDVLRTKIKQFASTISFSGKTKVVILDEADYLNPNSTQPALRGFIEEFAENCRFIFTCNYKNRIIPALHSRCAVIEFKIPKADKQKIATQFFNSLVDILTKEKIEFDKKVVARVVEKHFPDFRRTLNELQKYSQTGFIHEGIFVDVSDANIKELVSVIKLKDWKKMREWVVNNSDNDPQVMFRKIYEAFIPITNQVPQLVLTIADYQYKSAFVNDQEINLVACLTEIMASIEIKS